MLLPALTSEAQQLWDASGMTRYDLARLLTLAMKLTHDSLELSLLIDNIYPPVPTLAEARLAVDRLHCPEAMVIRRFLATIAIESQS